MARLTDLSNRLLDAFATWSLRQRGDATMWAAYASAVGVLLVAGMVLYLVFLRFRSTIVERRRARVESVWRPIFVHLLTIPGDFHDVLELPPVRKSERDDLIHLITRFSVLIPVSQRVHLKKLCDTVGLTAKFLSDLKSRNAWTRARASLMCGYAGVSESIPSLTGLLKDKDPLVVYDAARALGMLGDPDVIKEVVAVICRQGSWSRAKIIELLLEFGPGVAMETLRQFLSGNVAPNWLLPMIEIMGHFRVIEARPALEAVVRGEDETLSFAAMRALGRIGLPSSDWVLRGCLVSPSPRIRQAAAEALGMCMAVKAEQDLVELLSDTDVAVRQAAATALWTFGKRGEKKLWEVSARPGRVNIARDTAAWALQRASWTREATPI